MPALRLPARRCPLPCRKRSGGAGAGAGGSLGY